MKLIEAIEKYKPFNEQEEKDKQLILYCLKNNNNSFLRENIVAHVTASAWIVNSDKTKVLMAYHNIYNSWSWLGGHADGEEDLLKVALKEAMEESGITKVKPVTEEIYSLEVLTVDGHIKKGQYVSSHLHLNITYLLEADENQTLTIKPDENKGVRWFTLSDAIKASTEKWFRENIYTKLNKKLEMAAIEFKL